MKLVRSLSIIAMVTFSFMSAHAAKDTGSAPQYIPGEVLYRYKTDDGKTVMNSSIPPEYAQKGYQILSKTGRILEEIPPAPSPEEALAKEQAKRQQEYDALLLDNFPTMDDAIRSRDRKIESLQVRIDLNRGTILKLESDYREAQSEAAQIERNGKEVPEDLTEDMAIFKRQANTLRTSIENLEAQKAEIMGKYETVLSRLEILTKERDEKRDLILRQQQMKENRKNEATVDPLDELDTVMKKPGDPS